MTFLDFQPTSWLLFLWVSLLVSTRFESQRWLRALESGELVPVRRDDILAVLSLVAFVGQMVTWACYVWYGWKVGWQPAVGLVVLCNAATFLLALAPVPDSFLVWIVSSVAVIPLCVASLLTVYFL